MRLTVRCVSSRDETVVTLGYDLAMHTIHVAELVRPEDGGLTRCVNKEALDTWEHPELEALVADPMLTRWDMDEVEDFVTAYLNRRNSRPVQPDPEWMAELERGL